MVVLDMGLQMLTIVPNGGLVGYLEVVPRLAPAPHLH